MSFVIGTSIAILDGNLQMTATMMMMMMMMMFRVLPTKLVGNTCRQLQLAVCLHIHANFYFI